MHPIHFRYEALALEEVSLQAELIKKTYTTISDFRTIIDSKISYLHSKIMYMTSRAQTYPVAKRARGPSNAHAQHREGST